MASRWRLRGPGPVFAFEAVTASRRWRMYAGRSLFVAALLLALCAVWESQAGGRSQFAPGELAAVGRSFFLTLTAVQLVVVLLVAPAATAGAVCVDKARGTLHHVFTTALTDGEIVLGKLSARLLPVFAIVACGFPVMAIAGLLGGVDYWALAGAYAVTFGTAMVGCSVALLASIWAKKAHQALLFSYAVLAAWLALYPITMLVSGPWWGPRWFGTMSAAHSSEMGAWSNPFVMALSTYVTFELGIADPDTIGLFSQGAYLGATAFFSGLLLVVASGRLRPVVIRQFDRLAKREAPGMAARVVRRVPGPPLDGNPVLWREWNRKMPTKWAGRMWTVYAVVSALASLVVIVCYYSSPSGNQTIFSRWFGWWWLYTQDLAAYVNAGQVSVGLLLLSISSALALAEERDRGSLDVVMATPLETRTIVWGKWWGTFAMAPRFLILPAWISGGMAMVSGNFVGFLITVLLILAYAAFITSLGLALATWVPRMSRAVGWSVAAFVVMALGPILLGVVATAVLPRPPLPVWVSRPLVSQNFDGLLMTSPVFGIFEATSMSGRLSNDFQSAYYPFNAVTGFGRSLKLVWLGIAVLGYAAAAAMLAQAVLFSFDRCLGRVVKRPRWRGTGPRARPLKTAVALKAGGPS